MTLSILLDAGPLGEVIHARIMPELAGWVATMRAAGHRLVIPEISDYEVRRELILAELAPSLRRLDALAVRFGYAPITTPIVQRAAALWAQARRAGRPTADRAALDADMILCATALDL